MQQIADDVWQLPLTPRNGINAYLLGDVLVDCGVKQSGGKVLKALKGRTVTAHAATHVHPDHTGASAKVVRELGLDGLWCGALDAATARSGALEPAAHAPLRSVMRAGGKMPPVAVSRELRAGDEVGPGFTVLDAPGHSPGHVAFWREADGVLILGDVFFNMHIVTTAPGLRQPVKAFTIDPVENRRSERAMAALSPKVVGFGHGPVLSDGAATKLSAFVAALPAD